MVMGWLLHLQALGPCSRQEEEEYTPTEFVPFYQENWLSWKPRPVDFTYILIARTRSHSLL